MAIQCMGKHAHTCLKPRWRTQNSRDWLRPAVEFLLFTYFIISITKLLDADWLRGVQLMIFSKQTKWRTGGI